MTEEKIKPIGYSTHVCPCETSCPLIRLMGIIGGKWKIAILCALRGGDVIRYNQLKRKVKGITNTMLASSLKELEADGLVSRKQYAEMPVRVEYSLTSKSNDLLPIMHRLTLWSLKNYPNDENSAPEDCTHACG